MDLSLINRLLHDNETHILAVINQKGGVGKSTTAINLASALAEEGAAVLVIDLDPQGNTTSGFGIDKNDLEADIYKSLMGRKAFKAAILPTDIPDVYIVPATLQLAGAEIELVRKKQRETVLKRKLKPVAKYFDYVLIDCPPSLGLLTLNALVAATGELIPLQCEYYALEGVAKLLETTKLVQATNNPDLQIEGVLLTMYDARTSLSRSVANETREFFGNKVFKTLIPRQVKLAEAPSYGEPVTVYAPHSKGARAYRKLAREVLNRG